MKTLLIIDAAINLFLGVVLLVFTPVLQGFFGLPPSSTSFYPNILGAVFIGIALALLIGSGVRQANGSWGLGLLGAISINLCGGAALGLWLIFGNLDIPTRGYVVLWSLFSVLVGISVFEALSQLALRRKNRVS